MSKAKGLLIDIAGVLTDGPRAIGGSAEALRRLHRAGIPFRLITNTTSKPKRLLLSSLAASGFDVPADAVFAPAQVAVAYLSARGLAPFLVVNPAVEEEFRDLPQEGPRAVVVGDAGRRFDYDTLNAAFRLLMDGAEFVALATNRRFRDASGALSLDAGAFVAALEYASERAPVVLGKPAASFFETAARSMDLGLADVAMIGDDAEADVAGALQAGAGAAFLVRTGKYVEDDETRFDPPPTETFDDLASAVAAILS